jgi:hypothetical protein
MLPRSLFATPCCLDGNLMSLRRVLLSLACLSLGLLSACALRPQYKDMVQQQGAAPVAAGQVVLLRMTDPNTGKAIAGAKVVAGTGRERLSATTDMEGRLSVPVAKALLDENPLVEVVLPKGVRSYQFELSRGSEAPAQAPAEAPAAAPAEAPAAQPPAPTDSTGATPSGATDVKPAGEPGTNK